VVLLVLLGAAVVVLVVLQGEIGKSDPAVDVGYWCKGLSHEAARMQLVIYQAQMCRDFKVYCHDSYHSILLTTFAPHQTVNPGMYKGTSQNEVESCGEHFSQWIEGCKSLWIQTYQAWMKVTGGKFRSPNG